MSKPLNKEWRIVASPKRKRKLIKRGEFLKWSPEHQAWIWKMRTAHD